MQKACGPTKIISAVHVQIQNTKLHGKVWSSGAAKWMIVSYLGTDIDKYHPNHNILNRGAGAGADVSVYDCRG